MIQCLISDLITEKLAFKQKQGQWSFEGSLGRSDALHTLLIFVSFVFLCFLGSSDVLSVSPLTPGYAEQGLEHTQHFREEGLLLKMQMPNPFL